MPYQPTIGAITFAPYSPALLAAAAQKPSLAEVHALLQQAVEMLRALGHPGEVATQDKAWQQIVALTAKEFRVSEDDITTTQRTKTAAHCRGVVSLLARKYLRLTGTELDRRWGKSDGTSLHVIRAVQDRLETEPPFRASVARIEGCLVALCHFTPVP